MMQAPVRPLIAIVGATGTGKSDLAVELARKYDGEIINGDAMQLYQGLPIITNKITQEEMKVVPHHLLGCIGLEEETWTVSRFVEKALSTIEAIRSRSKLPILVGGTHYYTQSLLFQDALWDEAPPDLSHGNESFPILEEPTNVILAKLQEVDPIMADRWHPNERRKIRRSLEIFLKTGKPASQIYDEQRLKREFSPHSLNDSSKSSGTGMRSPTLVLWVHASKDILYPRLNGRVDKMLSRGLLEEVESLSSVKHDIEAATSTVVDQSRGIWASIGYKEFLDYQDGLHNKDADTADLEKLKTAAIEKTQAATRQYANRQIKWIRIKLLNALAGAGQQQNVFLFDGSDLSKWEQDVIGPAMSVTKHFLSGEVLPTPTSLSAAASEMLTPKREYDLGQRPDLWQKRVCDTCGIVAVTENDWSLHIKSRSHRRAVGCEKKQKTSKSTVERNHKVLQTDMIDVLESYMQTFPSDDIAD
ncbi:tRNA isopentenyltransferase [Ophiobolus disseminans]|uniref:tRNA dimethylallyltransferase n=1 Tax=Ophiobolus disseminans TaxID=1469910 RepID=A0A6A6ZLK1_9PLEO|nr:tRNA isopentenyltransferase [Ophiobolus disseminans]